MKQQTTRLLRKRTNLYDTADKYMLVIERKMVRMFVDYKSIIIGFDELNILKYTRKLYESLRTVCEYYFLLIAKEVYQKNGGQNSLISKRWLKPILVRVNPVTLYSYTKETNRKRDSLIEAIIALKEQGEDYEENIRRAMMAYQKIVEHFCDYVTDVAYIDALIERGVTKVMWMTEKDGRTCKICKGLDGQIFSIADIPVKPHANCRCWVEPVEE